MKTAISIPDAIFEDASRRAIELGVSRSQFFTTAAKRYLDDLDRESLTQQIDSAVLLVGDDESSHAAVAAGTSRLAQDADGW